MTAGSANLLSVESVGEEVRRRRTALGMDREPFAREAEVTTTTLRQVEEGRGFRDKSLAKIRRALDRLEEETSTGAHRKPRTVQVEQIEFTVEGDFGVKVTVKGPITDRAELEDSVTKIIRSIREGNPPQGV